MAARDRSREPLVKIAAAENPSTAELVRQLLEEASIPCLIKNTDPLGVIYGSLLTSPFAVQVFVLSGDEARAQAVLAEQGWDTGAPLALPSRPAPRRRHKRLR